MFNKKVLKMKTLLCVLVSLLMFTLATSAMATETAAESDFEFSNGVITKYVGEGGDVVIPSTIGGEAVTEIGHSAFSNCYLLESVTIPSSVKTIGMYAFSWCGSLETVTMLEGVETINRGAFVNCHLLTSVIIPEGVETIGIAAFETCKLLTSVTIPSSVETIGDSAFQTCTLLRSVTILEGVETVGDNAFAGCSSLESITIPASVETIGSYAFQVCSSLESVTILEGVKVIGDNAFRLCTSLGSITIPSSVETIGNAAFVSCSSLGSVTILEGVEVIGDDAFKRCTSLGSITIPSSVETIGDSAFYVCSSLESIIIPSSVETIGDSAFSVCSSLESIIIPSSVETIGASVFWQCSSLGSITIPSSVETIDSKAFGNCTSLTDVYYEGSESQWGEIFIDSGNSYLENATIHYGRVTPAVVTPVAQAEALEAAIQYVPYQVAVSGVTEDTTLISGSLPKGLGLFTNGTISGIPTQTGSFEFTLSNGNAYALTVSEGTASTVEANNEYEIIDRVPTITSNDDDQVYHIDGYFDKFVEFYVNGSKQIVDKEYVAEAGSTKITILSQTVAQMPAGDNVITAVFTSDSSDSVSQVSQQVTKTSEQVVESMPYTDVLASDWFYTAVEFVYNREIIAGTSEATYSPNDNLTRAMMVDALYQLAGTPEVNYDSNFNDVNYDAWYADAINWAAFVGVTQGTSDETFEPELSITREEMATMLQRYCDLMNLTLPLQTSAEPTDLTTISSWAKTSAKSMYQCGVLSGDYYGNFNPANTATRAEAASMFTSFVGVLDKMF